MRRVLGEDKVANNPERKEQDKPTIAPPIQASHIPNWFRNLQNDIMESKREKYGPLQTVSQPMVLYDGLKTQLGKLRVALDRNDGDGIARRAAHIANYAMLIAMNTHEEAESPPDKAEDNGSKYPEGEEKRAPKSDQGREVTPVDKAENEGPDKVNTTLKDFQAGKIGKKPE